MSEKPPARIIDLSILHLDPSEELAYIPAKADSPEIIHMRKSWPEKSVRYANQASGAGLTQEIARFPFTDDQARAFTFNRLSILLINSAYYTSAQGAEDVMRRVADLPIIAEDDDPKRGTVQFRETRAGSLRKLDANLARTSSLAITVFNLYKDEKTDTKKYEDVCRQFGRSAASAAMRMANMGLVPAPENRTERAIMKDVRTIALDMLEQSRYAHETLGGGKHPALAMLADDPRERWLQDAPKEAIAAFNSAFDNDIAL